jgi:GDP-L-fucose synthase
MGELAHNRILVTGGAGFLGKRLVAHLKEIGCNCVLAPRSQDYDLREQDAVRKLMTDLAPDVVVHLAAVVGGIGANQANPGTFFYDNLLMGSMLMEEARRAGVRKFVAVGTICAYPKFSQVPFREDDLWLGYPEETNAPYGLAKKMLLVQGQAYRQQYNFNAIYLMPVNLYGPGDNFADESSHVIPALIKRFVRAAESGAKEVVLWGDGTPTREFLYVDDCARAIALATSDYDLPDPVNLGSGFEISIADLSHKIAALANFRGIITWDTTKPNGQPRRRLDTTRARERFGFEAKVNFDQGLIKTVEWYKSTLRSAQSAK